jgi:hypothetical protein
MIPLLSIATARDIIIIIYGIVGIIAFFVFILVGALLFFSIRGLVVSVKEIMADSIKPTFDSVRDTARSIQGTTEFMGNQAVKPIIRTYGIVAGVRKGAGVIASLAGRKKS